MLLVFKNIAFGLGSDLEKGTVQTIFSYPLKRHAILTAKLISAIGVSLLLFFGAQMLALTILVPERVLSYPQVVVLTYVANLSYPLLLSFIILFVTLLVRKGGLSLVLGIVLSFLINILSGVAQLVVWMTKSAVPLQILAVFNPSVALQSHYNAFSSITGTIWEPSLSEVMLYVGVAYALVFFVLILSYDYFGRRLNL
jgi:ABC-type transport system involved in multi-copper enzyme maturation permease subunit